ncbi:MAG: membrane protein insertion efficiency factor YidD [Nanoarchaeota archaeon]
MIKVVYRKHIKVLKAKIDLKKRRINVCSYYPNCSEYGILALQKYGFFVGWVKTIKRIFRCNTYQHEESCIDYP